MQAYFPPTGTDDPGARDRMARADRALALLLLAGLLAQAAKGIPHLAARDEASHAPAAPVAVDLLRDPAWRLTLLPGIGPGRAWAIVRDRRRAPRYRRAADLERVPGIGPRTVGAIARTRTVRVLLDGTPVR